MILLPLYYSPILTNSVTAALDINEPRYVEYLNTEYIFKDIKWKMGLAIHIQRQEISRGDLVRVVLHD